MSPTPGLWFGWLYGFYNNVIPPGIKEMHLTTDNTRLNIKADYTD